MTFITQDNGVVSTNNSSTLNLASGETYTGTYITLKVVNLTK